jgi:hypothetical protein
MRATLVECAKGPFLGKGQDPGLEVFDWVYQYKFQVHPDHRQQLQLLLERADLWGPSAAALEQIVCHWGTQDWGCLTIDIGQGGRRFYRTDVDVFGPRTERALSPDVVVCAYSHKPDLLKKLREES